MVTGRIKHDGFGAKSKIQKTERGPVRLLNQDGKLPRRPHALKSSWRISWCGGWRRVYNKEKKNGHLEKQMLRSFWIIQNNCTLDWVMCSSQFIPLLKHSGALPTQLPFLHSLNSYWPSSWSLAPSFSSKSSKNMQLWGGKEWRIIGSTGSRQPILGLNPPPNKLVLSPEPRFPHLYNG